MVTRICQAVGLKRFQGKEISIKNLNEEHKREDTQKQFQHFFYHQWQRLSLIGMWNGLARKDLSRDRDGSFVITKIQLSLIDSFTYTLPAKSLIRSEFQYFTM